MFVVVMMKEKTRDHYEVYYHSTDLSADQLNEWGVLRAYDNKPYQVIKEPSHGLNDPGTAMKALVKLLEQDDMSKEFVYAS